MDIDPTTMLTSMLGGGDTNVEQTANQAQAINFNPVITVSSPDSYIEPTNNQDFTATQPVTNTQTPTKTFSMPSIPGGEDVTSMFSNIPSMIGGLSSANSSPEMLMAGDYASQPAGEEISIFENKNLLIIGGAVAVVALIFFLRK